MSEKSRIELIDEIRSLRAQLAALEAGRICWDSRAMPCAAQQRLAGVLSIAQDAIIAADSDHRITLFNHGAEKIFQYSAREVLGEPIHILVPETVREEHSKLVDRFIQGHEASIHIGHKAPIQGLRKDGTEFPAEASISKVTVGSKVTLTIILRDITERLRAERALAQARDQALEASRIKSAFLANMSHEIRTPMNGIIGMIDLLMATPLNEVQREYAQVIYDSAQALLALINDILDYSKIEANKLRLEITEFEPQALVEGVAELLAPKAREKGLALMTYVDPALPSRLRGDPVRLRQILLNLGDNAIKFTERGEVLIKAALAGQKDRDTVVMFSVRDTGIGIDPALQEMLFEPFVQADGTMTRRFGGTGLGLSICKRLVEQMSGQIGVKSRPNRGALFWFRVPLEAAASRMERIQLPRERSVRVLVVDDNRTACRIVSSYLDSWGIASTVCHGGEDALALLREAAEAERPYDVAIIDLRMPDADGMELGQRIKADPLIRSTHLILLTAFDAHGQGEKALERGFAAYMTKPVKQSHLYDCIVSLLSAEQTDRLQNDVSDAALRETSPGLKPSPKAEGRVLLVEDNPVNQKVVRLQLETLGYEVVSVDTGAEAVKAAAESTYSVILMDCQMPEMDGFEATRLIRRAEATSGRRVPIVALTANAMEGDRERCLSAGMDDYLSKPVSLGDLRAVLERWARPAAEPQEPGGPVAEPADEAGALNEVSPEGTAPADVRQDATRAVLRADKQWVSFDELLLVYGPDRGRVARLLELYVVTSTNLIDELGEAVAQHAFDRVRSCAHELKGSSNMIGAYPMGEASLALEKAANAGDSKGIESAFERLRDTFAQTEASIQSQLILWKNE